MERDRMETCISQKATAPVSARVWRIPRERALELIALALIVALAAALRFANLDALGYANHYYAAAVKAMLQSWHNFFFAAAEPGGSVSVDKPPVGLWFQAISAYFFGVNGFGLLLPQIVAGILSVIVVYHLVRRGFGAAAGLVAALALATTPVVVATDRNNTMDSTLILTLLLAAWAFVKATARGKLGYLLLGAILVGIGFNIKMLEAYLPLPAFFALYLLGSPERLWRKMLNLALATVLLLSVSLSWATIVDLTPADQRPYVGSSRNNSEWGLAIGYNGVERLLGMGGRGGLVIGLLGGNQNSSPRDGTPGQAPNDGSQSPQDQPRDDGFQPPQGFRAPQQQDGNGGFQPPPGAPGRPGGGFNIGQPGALRLFTAPLSKEASWLLPFGLFSALLLLLRARLHFPIAPKHQAAVLWGGWLVTATIFFSVAGFFHEYYLVMLAPPLAALVGIGVVELWRVRARHPWLALGMLLVAAGGTLVLQFNTASAFVGTIGWLPLAVGLFVVGAALCLTPLPLRGVRGEVGFACIVAALLLTPGIWSALTNLNASTNQSLPAAYSGGQASFGPVGRGGANTRLIGLQVNAALLGYLEANTQGMKYLMAVPSSMQGADYVLATGRPVLYLGGFNGSDPVVTSAGLAQLVADGELRFIYSNGAGGGFGGSPGPGGQSDISAWIARSCRPVQGFDTTTQNMGAPDGTSPTPDANRDAFAPGGANLQVSLYDCRR